MSEMQEGAACNVASAPSHDAAPAPSGDGMTRRSALGMLGAALIGLPWIGGGLAALGNYVGVPSRAFSGATIPDEVPAGLLSELADGKPKAIMFGDETVYVIKSGSGAVALSGTCPHAGCLIAVDAANPKQFKCPCHGGTFDFTGKYLSGPPPRGMFEHNVKISMGRVIVGRLKDA